MNQHASTTNQDSSIARQHHKVLKSEKHNLSINAWHLARYIIENESFSNHLDKTQTKNNFDFGEFFCLCEAYPYLNDHDPKKVAFINLYRKLEQRAGNVTARTLVATQVHGKSFISSAINTAVGQYLIVLSLITFAFLIALSITMFWPIDEAYVDLFTVDDISAAYYIGYFLAAVASDSLLAPFYAAGLGTCVYLLRQTQIHLKDRTFNPARIPGHFIRIMLGVIAGGTIVLFPDLIKPDATIYSVTQVGITQGSIAFLLGYSVEVFYDMLDGLKKKLSTPK